jgi:uncharacterized membrane protein required for colicin V production
LLGLNWLDITIICVLIIGILDGINKGFIISFFQIAGIFISLYLSRFLMVYSADFLINNNSIYNNLRNMFNQRITKLDSLTMGIIKLLNMKGNALTDSITKTFINVACFLIIFIISTIIINIFKNILRDKVKKSSLLHVDRFLGGGIGFTVAAIFVFVFFAVIIPVTTIMPKTNMLVTAIETSQLGKYFYYFNFIIPWLQKAKSGSMPLTIINFINYLLIMK